MKFEPHLSDFFNVNDKKLYITCVYVYIECGLKSSYDDVISAIEFLDKGGSKHCNTD